MATVAEGIDFFLQLRILFSLLRWCRDKQDTHLSKHGTETAVHQSNHPGKHHADATISVTLSPCCSSRGHVTQLHECTFEDEIWYAN